MIAASNPRSGRVAPQGKTTGQASRFQPILPSRDRAHWWDKTRALPLCYLAWGSRNYDAEPIPPYRCGGWQYILIQSGNLLPAGEESPQPVGAGTLLVVGPQRAFGWRAGCGRLLNCMWPVPATPELGSLPPDTLALLPASEETVSEFENIHIRCRAEVTLLDSLSPSVLHASQRLLEALILRRMRPGANSTESRARRLGLARHWMAEHLDSREPISRLCDYLDVAPATLHRDFVRQTGLSPAGFYHELKMQTALDLLREGFTIKETAATLGYRCFNDFSRAMHRYYGRPPSKLLDRLRPCPARAQPAAARRRHGSS